MRVLAVVAHPDDEVLGPGATLAKHASDGDETAVVMLGDGVSARYDEQTQETSEQISRRRERARRACDKIGVETVRFHTFPDNQFDTVPLLDLVKTIEDEIESFGPDVLYTHHHGDLNIDHELTARATVTAARPLPKSDIDGIYGFETLSSTEWSLPTADNAFTPTSFVDVSEHVDAKLDALRTYENELETHPHPRTPENVRRNLELWGAKSGLEAAEAFTVIRERR